MVTGLTLPSAVRPTSRAQCHGRLAPVEASATFAAAPVPNAELGGAEYETPDPSDPPISPIIALQTLADLEVALGESAAHGRLAVLKFYAPWCPACRAASPKYERDARRRPEHDWYEVNLKTARPIFKHANVTTMPVGVVYGPSGEQLFQHEMKKSQYSRFVEKLDQVAGAAQEEEETRDPSPLVI